MNFNFLNKKRIIKIGALLIVALLAFPIFSALEKGVKRSKQFSSDKITLNKSTSFVPQNKVTSELDPKIVNGLLDQPFIFLDKGKQCFAFESSDSKYVIKFVKQDSGQVKKMKGLFSSIFKMLDKQQREKKEHRLEELVQSLQIADKELQCQSGIIFVHLAPSNDDFKPLTLLDKKGTLHTIDINTTQFILQRKAALIKPVLVQLMHSGNIKEAQNRIHQIFSLLEECAVKGISDKDGALIRNNNIGFLEDRAVYIDIGKLTSKGEPLTIEEFKHNLRPLRPFYKFLLKNYPTLAKHFKKEENRALKSFST